MTDSTQWDHSTPRHGLPLLFAGQAQKEIHHNEALALIDMLIAPAVAGEVSDPSALTPEPGECWLVGAGATGDWAVREGGVACWTAGGWRHVAPFEGMRIYDREAGAFRLRRSGGWTEAAFLTEPSGGTAVDAEARSAIGEIIQLLRDVRLTAPSI